MKKLIVLLLFIPIVFSQTENYAQPACSTLNGTICQGQELCTGYMVPANDSEQCCLEGLCHDFSQPETPNTWSYKTLAALFGIVVVLALIFTYIKRNYALTFIIVVALFSLFLIRPTFTGHAINDDSLLYCEGADISELSSTSISACAQPYSSGGETYDKIVLIREYLDVHGLNNYDPLLVAAQFFFESGCRHPASNGQGIGQVVTCAPDGVDICGIEENVNRAINHLKEAMERLQSEGITDPMDLFKLTQFQYNRGVGTVFGYGSLKGAVDYLNEGQDIDYAMRQSCYNFYDAGHYYGCGGLNREECCNTLGGRQYPYTVLSKYQQVCEELGGTVTQGGRPSDPPGPPDLPEPPEEPPIDYVSSERLGFYYFNPTLRAKLAADLSVIDATVEDAKSFREEVQQCAFIERICTSPDQSFTCLGETIDCPYPGATVMCQTRSIDACVTASLDSQDTWNMDYCENMLTEQDKECIEEGRIPKEACESCVSTTCMDYDTEDVCNSDPCNHGCYWDTGCQEGIDDSMYRFCVDTGEEIGGEPFNIKLALAFS